MTSYTVLGMMSGTSLDGLDLALVKFQISGEKWAFEVLKSETKSYSESIKNRLRSAQNLSGYELLKLDHWFGSFLAENAIQFLQAQQSTPDLIVSHGHTIFHRPDEGVTFQLGNGQILQSLIKLPLVCDLRSQDVLLGGQGAPLVPGGEFDLFHKAEAFVNLGGFSNISFKEKGLIKAFDICPVNIVLNSLSEKLGKAYDENGDFARSGKIDQLIVRQLNELDYYSASYPKSLGKEWVDEQVFPIIAPLNPKDAIASFTHHVIYQLLKTFNDLGLKTVFFSGGGCYNNYLINELRAVIGEGLILPSNEIIEFKEAIVFAFLGLKKMRGELNCYSSVTGASKNHSTGLFLKKSDSY